jgi:molybdenum cofactor cytidylyltransferase
VRGGDAPGGRTGSAVASLVLAAGGSRRMGRPKLLLPFRGRTLLWWAVSPHLEADVQRVVVVLGEHAAEVRAGSGLPEDERLAFVVNPEWQQGLSSSLHAGLETVADSPAVLVALGDEPGVDAARVRAVREAFSSEVPLVVPVHEGVPGHPVLFAQRLFGELRALQGDLGGREVVRRHWTAAVKLALPPLADVDTEADYRALLAQEGRPKPSSLQ